MFLLKYNVGSELAKLGTLWSQSGGQFFCWNDEICLDRQDDEGRFVELNLTHLPFLLRCTQDGRLRASLTGQLEHVRFQKGEAVLVRRDKELCTGDPFDDLQPGSIEKIADGMIVVNGVSEIKERPERGAHLF